MDPRGATSEFQSVVDSGGSRDKAVSALSRGDLSAAESYSLAALRHDPKDPYALVVAGLTYESLGKYDLARQYFQVILTNNPTATMTIPDGNGVLRQRSIMEIARSNLQTIDTLTGRGVAKTTFESGKAPGAVVAIPPVASADANVIGRFRLLKRLLDEDLITPDEFNQRRSANLGGLMPYTQIPAAIGLERPVPPESQIIDRLQTLKMAVEAREMQPREAAAERTTILEGILPAQPRTRSLPPLPPKDVLDTAELIGRLERIKGLTLINADEFNAERAAIEKSLDAKIAAQPKPEGGGVLHYGAAPQAPKAMPAAKESVTPSKVNWGVALANAETESDATAALERVKSKFPEELAAITLSVRKITVANKERWQVVGPVDGRAKARALCKTLKLHRQACDAVGL